MALLGKCRNTFWLTTLGFLYFNASVLSDHIDTNSEVLLHTLRSVVQESDVARCTPILLSSTLKSADIQAKNEIRSFGRHSGKDYIPIVQVGRDLCRDGSKYCQLGRIFPKSTCFTFLVHLSTNSSIESLSKFLIFLLRPSTLNRAKYVFFATEEVYSKPRFLSHAALDYFQYKIEVTQSLSKNMEVRRQLLLYTYCSLNSKTFSLVGAFSSKTGLKVFGESLFPDLTRRPHTKSFNFSIIHTKAAQAMSSNKGLAEYSTVNSPILKFIEDLARAFNWTLESSNYDSLAVYKGGYLERLNQLKAAIGINYVPDRLSMYFTEISSTYSFVSLGYMEKQQNTVTTWDSLAYILRTTYPGYSYMLFIFMICVSVSVIEQLCPLFMKESQFPEPSLSLCQRLRRRFWTFCTESSRTFGLLNNISFLQHQMTQISRRKLRSVRLILFAWWLVSIWSSWNIRTRLTSLTITTSPDESTLVQHDFTQLVLENSDRIYGGIQAEKPATRVVLSKQQVGIMKHLESISDPVQCIRKILSSNRYYACVHFTDVLEAAKVTFPKAQRDILVMKPWRFSQTSYNVVLAFPKHFPYAEKISQRISFAVEAGLSKHWHQQALDALRSSRKSVASAGKYEKSEEEVSSRRQIYLLAMAFLVLYAISIAVFFIEISIQKVVLLVQWILRCPCFSIKISRPRRSNETFETISEAHALQDLSRESIRLQRYCVEQFR